ncbi:MAG: chemotaxis protein CheW [Legionella sp.]|nr:chemotaxis protein CheW [Legionella sp.]
MSLERKICTFYVRKHFFGIDVTNVQEVIRSQKMTHIPLAKQTISGLINLRGQIVTVIDMSERLGLLHTEESEQLIHLIVCTEDGPVSLLVDDIGDVIDVSNDVFEIPPENIKGNIRHMLKEVCKLDEQLLLLLDLNKVLVIEQEEA